MPDDSPFSGMVIRPVFSDDPRTPEERAAAYEKRQRRREESMNDPERSHIRYIRRAPAQVIPLPPRHSYVPAEGGDDAA